MKKLLNALFVTTEDSYLSLDGETVVIYQEDDKIGQFPLISLEAIFCFSYKGASPALMGACAQRGINMCFLTPNGRFLARVSGNNQGNVLLRKMQYRISDSEEKSCLIARNLIFGKVYNCRWSIDRTIRDHAIRIDSEKLVLAVNHLSNALPSIAASDSLDTLRGLEGETASEYFDVFDYLILNQKNDFYFKTRSRRPPMDNVNAMLSFAYTLLSNDCASALESVGLDSYVGFMHRDRPGRASLALDLMEELRPVFADRFVLTLINNKVMRPEHFLKRENGAVLMTDNARKVFLSSWQERKREQIMHPYIKEKISWGLVPYVQALLLARYLRDDIDGYPPFLWK